MHVDSFSDVPSDHRSMEAFDKLADNFYGTIEERTVEKVDGQLVESCGDCSSE
jgi:hypothetical protein